MRKRGGGGGEGGAGGGGGGGGGGGALAAEAWTCSGRAGLHAQPRKASTQLVTSRTAACVAVEGLDTLRLDRSWRAQASFESRHDHRACFVGVAGVTYATRVNRREVNRHERKHKSSREWMRPDME
jgi:hypothetical protein